MVEASEKQSQKPPSAEELAQAERYEAMMAAVAKDDDDDYDFEDDDEDGDNGILNAEASAELAKQRKLLASVAQQVANSQQQHQLHAAAQGGIDFNDMEDHDEIMRQIYEENLILKQGKNGAIDPTLSANQLLQMQAEQLANSGIDPVQALQILKGQQQYAGSQTSGATLAQQQMVNPTSCLLGNLPNNLDIDLNEVMQAQQQVVQQPQLNGTSGQVDMTQFQGMFEGQPGMTPTQNQLDMQQMQSNQQQVLPSSFQQPGLSWIQWFNQLEGHDFLLPVPAAFLKDKFNQLCLSELNLPKTRLAQCRTLMSRQFAPTDEELQNEQFMALNADTSDLYGLLHSRYIRSPEGLALVYGRYLQGGYGYCPRAFCDKQRVVPNGLSDKLRQNRVKVYCPKCEEMYIPSSTTNRVDGAYFGSSLAHVFFQVYEKNIVLPPKVYYYEPQLFGFAIAGKRGSKYFRPGTSGVTDTHQRQQQVEAAFSAAGGSAVQEGGSSQTTQQQGSSSSAAQPQSNKHHRNNKSRHRAGGGRKN